MSDNHILSHKTQLVVSMQLYLSHEKSGPTETETATRTRHCAIVPWHRGPRPFDEQGTLFGLRTWYI